MAPSLGQLSGIRASFMCLGASGLQFCQYSKINHLAPWTDQDSWTEGRRETWPWCIPTGVPLNWTAPPPLLTVSRRTGANLSTGANSERARRSLALNVNEYWNTSGVQTYLNGIRHGQAFQGWVDDIIAAEHHKQRHHQRHGGSHEVQPEGEPASAGVKQQIVVGVDVVQGLETTVWQRTGGRFLT